MSVKLTWTGLDELRDAWAEAPAAVMTTAHEAVHTAADATVTELRSGYPEKTGLMKAKIYERERETSTTYAIDVVSGAPHAHLWEAGTKARETKSGHRTGRVPAHRPESLEVIAEQHGGELLTPLTAVVERIPGVASVTGD